MTRISGALNALAPHLADDVATLFPFPHHAFFELAPARMHLLGMLIAGSDPYAIDLERLRSLKWNDAATMLADPSPAGLEGILSSMPLPMWSADEYRVLWSLAPCQKAMTVMRHAREVTANLVAILAELPPTLRVSNIYRHMRRPVEASAIAKMCDTLEKTKLLLDTVSSSDSLERFYEKLLYVVRRSDVFPTPPTIDHDCVRPILDVNDLRQTALEFGNCLRAYADQVAAGSIAFYLVEGPERAIVSVKPQIGDRLVIDDINGVANVRVSREAERRIRKIFDGHGMVRGADERRRELIEQCLLSLRGASMKAEDEIVLTCWSFLQDLGELASVAQ